MMIDHRWVFVWGRSYILSYDYQKVVKKRMTITYPSHSHVIV